MKAKSDRIESPLELERLQPTSTATPDPPPRRDSSWEETRRAFVRVGGGRGFFVRYANGHAAVITAAHCLPYLPEADPLSSDKHTFAKLVGPLSARRCSLWTTCAFVDPIADVAVLVEPDSQQLVDECGAWNELAESVTPLRISPVPKNGRCRLLDLSGTWHDCTVAPWGSEGLSVASGDPAAYAPGTSGSPVLAEDGRAVAVISTGGTCNPVLVESLPARILIKAGSNFLRKKA
jgi:hypothetical protein